MRKAIFLLFVALGAAVGLLATVEETWGVRILMTVIGTVAGVAIGGALSGIGIQNRSKQSIRRLPQPFDSEILGRDLERDYWRDRGHPPFMKPPSAELNRHMFDPDRQD
ncbi:hypothetical protein [Azohydromonas australica]|uniref:hypothetical protein n=1 Tax=Azohydromonas australica TaxID=364039 RepID=UPI000A04A5EF|nr:hypothetical protein [Azohydromonas australica]